MEQEFAKQNEPGAREAAYDAMRRAIATSPHNPETFDRFARIQVALGDTEAAIETLRHGVAATDSNALRIALARRLIEANRLAQARQVIRDALDREPTNAAALDLQKQIGAQ
jgi:predicted Zn-dependent protease